MNQTAMQHLTQRLRAAKKTFRKWKKKYRKLKAKWLLADGMKPKKRRSLRKRLEKARARYKEARKEYRRLRKKWKSHRKKTPPLYLEGPTPGSGPVPPEDLQGIPGIGPRLEALLHQSGILTLRQLAQTPVERLRELLQREGFAMHNPESWPRAARELLGMEEPNPSLDSQDGEKAE